MVSAFRRFWRIADHNAPGKLFGTSVALPPGCVASVLPRVIARTENAALTAERRTKGVVPRGVGGFLFWYRPGTCLTDWTGEISDTANLGMFCDDCFSYRAAQAGWANH